MARIAGIDLPRDKRIEIGLTYIYGIGRKTATDILAATGIDPDIRVRDLTEDDASKLREYIERNYRVEGDLRREHRFRHQETDRNSVLPRNPSSQRLAGKRPALQDKRSYPQRSEEDHGEQEEVSKLGGIY